MARVLQEGRAPAALPTPISTEAEGKAGVAVEEVEEEIVEDITETHDESVDFGAEGDLAASEASLDDKGKPGGGGGSVPQVGTESLMSLGSVESEDLPGASAHMSAGEGSGDFGGAGFQSVASGLASAELEQLATLLEPATVALLRDPARAWLINTLTQLYSMTKARQLTNRYAFYDEISKRLLLPLSVETT